MLLAFQEQTDFNQLLSSLAKHLITILMIQNQIELLLLDMGKDRL
jgi:hypothetical protein